MNEKKIVKELADYEDFIREIFSIPEEIENQQGILIIDFIITKINSTIKNEDNVHAFAIDYPDQQISLVEKHAFRINDYSEKHIYRSEVLQNPKKFDDQNLTGVVQLEVGGTINLENIEMENTRTYMFY